MLHAMEKHASGYPDRNGFDLDDWLRRQRDLGIAPESRLLESETEFEMKVAVPGMEAKDILISALPGSIVVLSQRTSRGNEGDRRCAVFGATRILRRFKLLPDIDVAATRASIKKGILTIVAPKLAEARERKIPITDCNGESGCCC